ncbi:hypothetical protein ScPMuIL_002152, partial [Solemya velum]
PNESMQLPKQHNIQKYINEERQWVDKVMMLHGKGGEETTENISWSAHHAHDKPSNDMELTQTSLLPLFPD